MTSPDVLGTVDIDRARHLHPAGTSPILDNDQELYGEFFRRQWAAEHYGNSWSYLTQACRGLGYGRKYVDGDRLLSYGRHGNHYVIVRPMGSNMAPALGNLAQRLHDTSRRPVYVKHVDLFDAASLRTTGEFQDMAAHPWCPEADRDDATFPEVVVPIAELLTGALQRPTYQKLRMMLNRFDNHPGGTTRLAARICTDRDRHWPAMACHVIRRWAEQGGKSGAAYTNMLRIPSRPALRYIVMMHGEPVGFYVFERIGARTAGCYASLSLHTKRRGLAEAGFCTVFDDLFHHHGIDRVNLGGSELRSLHSFKLKFGVEHPARTTNLVFRPTPR